MRSLLSRSRRSVALWAFCQIEWRSTLSSRGLYADATHGLSRPAQATGCEVKGGVAAVDRALTVLAAFDEGADTLGLAELAERTGLYKSTILRLAASLERFGYLRRLEDGRFALGPSLLRLGELYRASFDLGRLVLPALKRLSAETGESAAFYVREGDERVCLYRVASTAHRVLHYVTPGTRFSLTTGASGQVLRAFAADAGDLEPELAAVRAKALAVSLADRKAETAAIAAPVFGAAVADGTVGLIGSLSLAGPASRFTPESLATMSEALTGEARSLTAALGGAWPATSAGG